MCIGLNFLAANGMDEPYHDDKNSGHSDLKSQLEQKDEKLFNRGIVSIEVYPCGSLVSQNIKDWYFKVDEEGTLPSWFDSDVWKTRCIDRTLEIVSKIKKTKFFGGSLYLQGTQITSLPSGLKVGGYLDLRGTQITKIPKRFKNKVIR
jgi:hypothetical protein